MKKIIYFFSMLCIVCLCSCEPKNEPEIDPREKFVGAYTLDVTSNVTLSTGEKTVPYDMSAKGKSLNVSIDPSSKDKFIISGYYGNTTATLKDGKMFLAEDDISDYSSGIYVQISYTHGGATISGTRLTWTTGVVLAAVGSSGVLAGAGTLTNTATKK